GELFEHRGPAGLLPRCGEEAVRPSEHVAQPLTGFPNHPVKLVGVEPEWAAVRHRCTPALRTQLVCRCHPVCPQPPTSATPRDSTLLGATSKVPCQLPTVCCGRWLG